MGIQVYLSEKEVLALIDTCSEWSSIMGDGEETADCVEERLHDGLGSALYKLNRGRENQRIYKQYIK